MDFLALIKDSHNTCTFSLLLFFSVLVHMVILEEDFVISVFLRSTRNSHFPHDILNFKNYMRGRSQDGGGVGRGDHFLFYKFIERTTER